MHNNLDNIPLHPRPDDHQPETLSLHHIIPHCHSTVHGASAQAMLNYLCSRTLPSKSNAPVWPVWEATRMQDNHHHAHPLAWRDSPHWVPICLLSLSVSA